MKEKSENNTDRSMNENTDMQVDETLIQEQETPKEEIYQLKTKTIPALVMLMGGAVSSIVTYINHYTLENMLLIVLLSLIGFYILGMVLKKVFDSFHIVLKKEEEEMTEGEVIEKEQILEKDAQADKNG